MELEIWKKIKGYGKKYEVSNFGNIRNIKTGKHKVIRIANDSVVVTLTDNDMQHIKTVARLVYFTFKPRTEPKIRIAFKDGDSTNICLDNLMIRKNTTNLNKFKPVVGSNVKDNSEILFDKLTDVIDKGFSYRAIQKNLRGDSISSQGYVWRYV